jgi:hypothetical protein
MAVVEDVTGDDNASGDDHNASTKAELLATLWQLSKRLALPEELLPSFMNEEKRTSPFSRWKTSLA